MKTISKSKLKPKMLEIFREIERTGEGITVTDHGNPVLEIKCVSKKLSIIEEMKSPYMGKGKNLDAALDPLDPKDFPELYQDLDFPD